jgi:DNA polymerase III epsilon subunit-like protein
MTEMINKTNYLIFDTETSGLPECIGFDNYHDPKQTRYYDSSRIVQIAWEVYNSRHELVVSKNFIIKPLGFVIPASAYHKVTQASAEVYGVSFTTALAEFMPDVAASGIIIAHNISFDLNVLLSEVYRVNDTVAALALMRKRRLCTMKATKKWAQIPSSNNGYRSYKYPKLIELFQKCTNELVMDGAHDALWDVKNTGKCVKVLCEKGVIDLSAGV